VIEVEPFAPTHLDGFAKLFEASSSSCFCRYWHFTGNKNEWLERGAFRPEENLAEQAEAVRRGDPTARGFVAIDRSASDALVGWMKVAPRDAIPKLTRLPVYKNLAFEPGSWSIGCFLVHPSGRRRGVARALVQAAVHQVGTWGARVLEGHPRRATSPLHDEEAWQGPESVFVELGFTAVHDVAPYPVYRKVIVAPAT
jgi:GNAT superfamily N-acetyltransferase